MQARRTAVRILLSITCVIDVLSDDVVKPGKYLSGVTGLKTLGKVLYTSVDAVHKEGIQVLGRHNRGEQIQLFLFASTLALVTLVYTMYSTKNVSPTGTSLTISSTPSFPVHPGTAPGLNGVPGLTSKWF